jgi:hypothetical protein
MMSSLFNTRTTNNANHIVALHNDIDDINGDITTMKRNISNNTDLINQINNNGPNDSFNEITIADNMKIYDNNNVMEIVSISNEPIRIVKNSNTYLIDDKHIFTGDVSMNSSLQVNGLNMNNNTITNVANPIQENDAVNKSYADTIVNDLSLNVNTEIGVINGKIENINGGNEVYVGMTTTFLDFTPNGSQYFKFVLPPSASYGKYIITVKYDTQCISNTNERYYVYDELKENIIGSSQIFKDRYDNITNGCVITYLTTYTTSSNPSISSSFIALGPKFRFFDDSVSVNVRVKTVLARAEFVPDDVITIGFNY